MKKVMMFAVAASMVAFAAHAATTTKVKFEQVNGPTTIVTFNSETKTFTAEDGQSGTYTLDEAAKKLCMTTSKGVRCGVSEMIPVKVGDSTTITDENGVSAKVTVIE